jgi:hypothetical protein
MGASTHKIFYNEIYWAIGKITSFRRTSRFQNLQNKSKQKKGGKWPVDRSHQPAQQTGPVASPPRSLTGSIPDEIGGRHLPCARKQLRGRADAVRRRHRVKMDAAALRRL